MFFNRSLSLSSKGAVDGEMFSSILLNEIWIKKGEITARYGLIRTSRNIDLVSLLP